MSRRYDFDEDEPYVVIEKQSGTLSSFFIGAAIGAGLALLFAPQSGARTRRDLQRRARRAQRTARKVATDVTDTVVDKFHDARRQVDDDPCLQLAIGDRLPHVRCGRACGDGPVHPPHVVTGHVGT